MSVTICTFGQIASCLNAFFEAAADGDEAAALFTAVMKAIFTVAIGGGVSFELVKSASISVHVIDLHIELKTN